jgi:DNA-binding IscR family transcriptional regulator
MGVIRSAVTTTASAPRTFCGPQRTRSGASGRTREQARSTVDRAIKQVEEVFSEALARISLQDLTASDMRNRGE